MDRSKNRTDMLAAGRKKLQQFRQKKDGKGGGSHAKSSSRVTGPGNEGEEPSNGGTAAPATAVDLVDANLSYASTPGADQRAEELRLEFEQLPANFDNQEAHGVVLGKSNGSGSGVSHDLDATTSSVISDEVARTSSSSEVVHERGGDLSVSYVNSHTELSEKENGGGYQMEKRLMLRETSPSTHHEPVRLQETNGSSVLADKVQGLELDFSLSEEIEKDTYPEQILENPDSFQITCAAAAISYEGAVSGVESEKISYKEKVEDEEKHVLEDKLKVTSDPAVYGSPRSEETNQDFNPADESQYVGLNLCHESNEGTSIEKFFEVPSSSQEISVNDEELHLELGERTNKRGVEHCFMTDCLPANDGCQSRQPEKAVSVKEIIVIAHKEGLSSLQEYIKTGSSVEGQFEQDGVLMKGSSAVNLESLKRHLYLSYIAKDILQLQLVEQTQLHEDFYQHSLYDVQKLFDLVKKAQEGKEMLTEEFVQSKSELQYLAIMKDEIDKEIEQEQIKCFNLKSDLHKSQEDVLHVSNELPIYRGSVDALQKENSNLLASLLSETHAKKRLVEEVAFLSSEQMKLAAALVAETDAREKLAEETKLLSTQNMNLLSELTAKEEKLQIALEKKVELQDNLRELWSCVEQLVEDNFSLSCNLDIRNSKIKEMESWTLEPSCHGQKGQTSKEGLMYCTIDMSQPLYDEFNADVSSSSKLKSNSLFQDHGFLIEKVDGKDSDRYALLKVLKEHLQEAKTILQDLDKSVQVMHSNSRFLSGSSGVATTTGVSKLIKAFESKAHDVGSGVDEVPSTLGEKPEDSYALSREQTLSLSTTLNRMELELGKVEIHVTDNQHNREALKKYKMDCETQKHEKNSLQVAFDELAKKLVDYESKVYKMSTHIGELHQHVNEEAAGFLDEIELLKRKVSEDVFILKQERDVLLGMILEAVGKLDASTGLKVLEEVDTRSHVMVSVDAAILTIEKLNGKLEETSHNYNTLHDSHKELNKSFMDIEGRHALVMELFNKFYSNLLELIHEAQQNTGDAAINASAEKVLEYLPEKCEMVINYLRKLLSERVYLLSRNTELDSDLAIRNKEIEELNIQLKELELQSNIKDGFESTLLNKTKEIEEVKRRCSLLANQLEDHESCKDLYANARSCEKGEVVVSKDANVVVDSFNCLLLRLEELVSFHLHNYEEILEQIILSRKHLQDAHVLLEVSADDCVLPLPTLISDVLIPKVTKLHEKLKLLTVSNVQNETEIQILKEGMSKIEETLETSCHELQLKASEVEQLEQKLSSVREKLGIAVAKGKGLIVQRDSLKQSLMEKTSELEKSAQDLLLKDSLLDELETKLKSCSEVERIEALESELSYIRNSATVLRDSFLQKDSVLQRIEEILEDLQLPDDFHDKDILEKIELLSRFAVDHPSLTVTDLEQKCLEERTHSDAGGCVVSDGNKNCMWPGSNQNLNELKRKHEELQGKFYGLAEHNDMLEQSLLERNNIVRKWEEILDRIEFPSHVQTMEPEDKIEWLSRELLEVNQERVSLQLKIDNLETSSDMLIVDVEESHKKISELTAEVIAVRSDKEFFSESLEKLRFEYFALSEKAVHDEQDRENLQKEINDLQDKLIDSVQFEYYKDVENNLQKLNYLVNRTLRENDKVDFHFGGSLVEHLEESLKKLIDNYTAHLSKSSNIVPINETLLVESSLDHGEMVAGENRPVRGKMVPEETLLAKESELASMSLELDRISNKLVSVEQDRDAIFGKCQSLMLEVEDIKMQVDVLNAERNADLEKYQSLALDLNAMEKQRDSLQEQLTQEEQKTASVKEKLNLAVRKGKGLVQQRDSLKQTIDEMNAWLEQLKIDHTHRTEALISEKSLLMRRLADVELNLQDSNQNYNRLLTALHAIDLQSEAYDIDPVEKLGVVSSMLLDMRSSTAAAEREANKSKRAAELLLTELNEVQERNDILQDELVKAETSLAECSKQKDDYLSRLDHIMSVHFEERTRLAKNLMDSMLVVDQLRGGLMRSSRILSEVLSKDVDLFHFVDDLREFTLDEFCSSDRNRQPFLLSSDINDQKNEEISLPISDTAQFKMHQILDETLLFENFVVANQALHECMNHCNELRERICKHSLFLDKKAVYLSETVDAVKRKNSSLKDNSESLKRDVTQLESKLKKKDAKISSIYRNLIQLYEACSTFVMETVGRKSQITGNSRTFGEDVLNFGIVRTLPSYDNLEEVEDVHSINDHIKMMVESILSTLKDTCSTNELVERNERDLKSTILALQRDLQEKDIQMNRVCEELVSQIKDAETVAKRSVAELDSSRSQISNLEMKAEAVETNRNLLELRLNELQEVEALSKLLQERISSLTETLNAKDQEIEALMQALDEEETQMEALESRNKDLDILVQQRVMQLETLETSHAKTVAKLSTTVRKFDELRYLSESLLLEVENLQSQLHERDTEICFFRKEVTKCTNDVLASQENNKKYSSEAHELLTWMKGMISHFGGPPVQFDDQEASQIHLYIDILGKKIASAINELEELRATIQCKDALLETERGRIEELLSRTEDLKSSLHGKERLEQQGDRGSEQQNSSNSSGTLEIEQMVQRNKVSSGPIATIVRSGRKVNNDQIAIAIDSEKDDGVIDDEDDDKAHGFKSLNKSRLIPRATRPIADRIDGIWVSAERLLMRQPTLRLAFLMYWVALHALLASFI